MSIIIYSKANCIFCEKAKNLLTKHNMEYQEVDILQGDALGTLQALVPGVRTVPQIFMNGVHIGGYTELVKRLS